MALDLNTLIFNGKNSLEDIGVGVQDYPPISLANENYTEYTVDGRNGSLIVNQGTYPDIKIPFDLCLVNFKDFHHSLDAIEDWLTNIEDNKLFYERTDRCYKVKKVIKEDIKRQAYYGEGEFKATFLCEPFLNDPEPMELEINTQGEIFYAGNRNSLPITKVYGNGRIELRVNDNSIELKNVENYIELNSNLLKAIDANGQNKDIDTNGNFPYLIPGENKISWIGNVEKIILEFENNYR
ncbi:TPA: distal tail protein Dit [Clostridium perfringens]